MRISSGRNKFFSSVRQHFEQRHPPGAASQSTTVLSTFAPTLNFEYGETEPAPPPEQTCLH
jgi:hypothetical protein